MSKITLTIIAFILLSVVAPLTGCNKNKWLDIKPNKNLVIPSTLKDFQAILDYYTYYGLGLAEIASDEHYMLESDWLARSDKEKNAYIRSHEFTYQKVEDWNLMYNQIFNCNVVLEGLSKIPTDIYATETYNTVYGHALFVRAMCFFTLSQTYAPPFNESTSAKDPGIVLRLESDINIPSVRTTVKAVYDQVLQDLLEAARLLPVTPLYKTRPSKPAAFGMLSRVYLSMGNYEKAGLYADSCLRLYSTLLDYAQLSPTASHPFAWMNEEVIYNTYLVDYATLRNKSFINPTLYDAYEPDDLRKKLFFSIKSSGNIAFKGSYTGATIMFAGLASDEVYLNRAECFARGGKVTEAMKDLNDLLRTRWKKDANGITTYVDQTAASADEALAKILEERKKELLMRGIRWTDLRRLRNEPEGAIVITRAVNGKTYTADNTEKPYVFPIPDDIIEATGMLQNE